MEKKIKIVFLNELDLKIFDEIFYSHLLKNVVNLIKEKDRQVENGILTCACLEQVNDKNANLTCASGN